MKKGEIITIIVLIIAIISLGVYYINIIKSEAEMLENQLRLRFSEIQIPGVNTNVLAMIDSQNRSKSATINISEVDPEEQEIPVTFVIMNESKDDLTSLLKVNITHTNSEWFEITHEFLTETVEKGSHAVLVVRIKLLKPSVTKEEIKDVTDSIIVTLEPELV